MSRLARHYPDDPEMWANPLRFADARVRCADPRCGRRVSPTYGSVWCANHDQPLEDER